jgi:hypothetical protein
MRRGLAMARSVDPRTYSGAVTSVYGAAIQNGVLRPDDSAIREIEDAVHGVEQFGDEFALAIARLTLGLALLNRRADPERDRGQKLLADVSDMFLSEGHNHGELPIVNVYLARERARRSVVGAWSVNPQHAVISDGVRSHYMASSDALRALNQERLQALLKPVSQVRILPGAQVRHGI